MQQSRTEHERALAKSLSRYIGYTTAAYDLDRIFGILFPFASKPSAYEIEIIESLKSNHDATVTSSGEGVTEEYIVEAIRFATSLDIIEVVSDHHTKIRRFAPTQTGRSIMGAKALGDNDFYQFYRTKVVLEADAHAIVPVLLLSKDGVRSRERFIEYQRFHEDLRKRRLKWLQVVFPDRRLLLRVVEHLPWIKRKHHGAQHLHIETLSENTARHHVTPRSRWVVQLGLCGGEDNALTSLGATVLDTLMCSRQYFWLGPSKGVQEGLRIRGDARKSGATEDGLKFVQSPKLPSSASIDALLEDTADAMTRAYVAGKLVYAPQASLRLPIEYIAYRCYRDNAAYEWTSVLPELFRRYRPRLERLSARKGPVGFYKVRDLR